MPNGHFSKKAQTKTANADKYILIKRQPSAERHDFTRQQPYCYTSHSMQVNNNAKSKYNTTDDS